MDLVGAIRQAQRAQAGIHGREREVAADPAATVGLDGPIDDAQRDVGCHDFDGGDLDRRPAVADGVHQPRRLQREEARLFDLHARIGDPFANHALFGQRPAERDPLGAGYHIIQSKIALGSGGLWGKGLLNGSQAQLSFLPEKQTDFAFTMLAEETGFFGGLVVLLICFAILMALLAIGMRAAHQFGRLLAIAIGINFFLYVTINVAMVTGLIPVVGVPLPLVSYGGTAMLTTLIGFGLVLCIDVNRFTQIPRFPVET